MARVYSVLLKKALPKKPLLSRNGATQLRTDSIVQFMLFLYMSFGVLNTFYTKGTHV